MNAYQKSSNLQVGDLCFCYIADKYCYIPIKSILTKIIGKSRKNIYVKPYNNTVNSNTYRIRKDEEEKLYNSNNHIQYSKVNLISETQILLDNHMETQRKIELAKQYIINEKNTQRLNHILDLLITQFERGE